MVAGEPSSFAPPRGVTDGAPKRAPSVFRSLPYRGEHKKPRARYDEVARPWLLGLRLQEAKGRGVGLAFGLFVEEVLAIADEVAEVAEELVGLDEDVEVDHRGTQVLTTALVGALHLGLTHILDDLA